MEITPNNSPDIDADITDENELPADIQVCFYLARILNVLKLLN